MNDWLTASGGADAPRTPAVLVTVAAVEGSGPREPGAKMLVTAGGQADTIGGGHLELCAVELARGMLMEAAKRAPGAGAAAGPDTPAPGARLVRYALGPTLGQCCGGVVHLAFEFVDQALAAVLACLRARGREDSWRLSAIDGPPCSLLFDERGAVLAGTGRANGEGGTGDGAGNGGGASGAAGSDAPAFARARGAARGTAHGASPGTYIFPGPDGRRWLADACLAPRAHLLLFGAGHVGAAIVRMLGELPCTVTWVDERDDMFPAAGALPANVTAEASDTPEALVAAAPAGASYLVMTHSHALDQRLAEAILARDDAGWFGMIGSHTKRVQFERRMAARGLPAERIAAMACPIGLPGITSKLPAAIAASVCAQLLMVWEAQALAAGGAGEPGAAAPASVPVPVSMRLVASR